MKKYKWLIIILNLIAVLAFFNFSVYKKEKTLNNGKLVYIALAPVDPRSLMQGDYMTLNYDLNNSLEDNIASKRGFCIVELTQNNVAKFKRLQSHLTPLKNGEYAIKYFKADNGFINIGAESYFFQEGTSEKYENAEYGGLKIDEKGNSILIGLYDKKLKLLK